jgi:uncharacterized membrane protein YdbT with pleckstrin-like domain
MSEQQVTLKPTTAYALLRSLGQFTLMGVIIFTSWYFGMLMILSVLVLPILILTYRILYWRSIRYDISPQQIIYARGIFRRKVDFLEMHRIKDFDQRQSFLMNLLGIMHIRLMTSDISHPMLELKGIPRSNIAEVLRQLIEKSRKENRVYALD